MCVFWNLDVENDYEVKLVAKEDTSHIHPMDPEPKLTPDFD